MLKLTVKQDFNDWATGARRFAGSTFEATQERYDELKKNLEEQGVDIDAVVEIVKEPKSNKKDAGDTPAK